VILTINSLLIKYDHLIGIMLEKATIVDIKLDMIAKAVVAEWERTSHGLNLNKMTNIQQKKQDPSFQQQCQQPNTILPPPPPANAQSGLSSEKNPQQQESRRIRREKQSNQHQQQQHQHSNVAEEDRFEDISHMASAILFGHDMVALAPHIPPQTTVLVTSMGPSGLRVQRRPINLPSQSFTKVLATIVAQTPGYSAWKSVADAQKIAEALGVPKSYNNICQLEEISTDFLSGRSDTPPPSKRQRTQSSLPPKSDDAVSLGEDDRILLDWGSDLEDATRIVDLATGQDLDIFTRYIPHTQGKLMMTNEFTSKPLNTKKLKLLFNINIHVAIEYTVYCHALGYCCTLGQTPISHAVLH